MNISVIISTYNRAPLLKRALHALAFQTFETSRFEIIVVDDGSFDDTKKICNKMCQLLPNIRCIYLKNNIGKPSALNRAIKSAKGENLLFIDDDCIARKDWVERLSNAIESKPIVAGAVESPFTNYIKLCHNIANFHTFMQRRKADSIEFIAGANMGIKRHVLEDLNYFQEGRRVAFDTEFILRARTKAYNIYFDADAVVTHDPENLTLKKVLNYSVEHASESILLRNQYQSLMHTPFILKSPILILVASPLIALLATFRIYWSNFNLNKVSWTMPLVFTIKMAWCIGAAIGLIKSKKKIPKKID